MKRGAVGARGRLCLEIARNLFRETASQAKKVRLPAMASSLAFTTVMSIVPLLAVAFYVFKAFGGFEYAYDKLLPFLLDNLSEGTGEIVEEHLGTFVQQVHAKAVGWAGIAGLFVTTMLTYFNIVGTFNLIWDVNKHTTFQHRIIRAMTLITIVPMLTTASIVLTTAVATHIKGLPFSGHLVAFLLSTMLYTMVYGLVPMVKVPFKILVLGSLLPALLWELAKSGYAIYTRKMVTYSAFYGSFAAIPLFLLWIYIAWLITLFGAVWVRTLQRQFAPERKRTA